MKSVCSIIYIPLIALILNIYECPLIARTPAVEEAFNSAQKAYDSGDFQKAQHTYSSLLNRGILSANLFFNLGNSLVRQGKMSQAILAYRRAWMLAPRDPDIQANLKFSLNNAQALAPKTSKTEKFLQIFSNRQWLRISTAAYWMATLCLMGHLAIPKIRPVTGRIVIALLILLLIGISGIMSWQSLKRRPELVIVPPQQKALFAPLETATPSFALPAGSIVRLEEKSGEWNKIRHGNQSGWIKSSACTTVYPFHAAPDVL